MLRILEAEHVGDLLHACLRLEQGVLRSFDYLELDVFSRGPACLRLHQISEIVGRQTYLGGEVLHRGQSVQLRHSGIPVVVQQPLETHKHVVVQFLARDELAFVETHAVVEQDLDVRNDKGLGELVDRMLEFAGNLSHVILYDQPFVDRQVQGLIGCIGEEGVLPYLLGQRGAVQEIGVEQQGVGFRHGAALDALDADGLPRGEAYHGLVVVVVLRLSIIDGAAHGLFQEEGVKAESHPVFAFGRLAFRTVEMDDADQRVLGAESEKPVILFDGVRLDDFHVRFVCPKITLFRGKHHQKRKRKPTCGSYFRKIDTNSVDLSTDILLPPYFRRRYPSIDFQVCCHAENKPQNLRLIRRKNTTFAKSACVMYIYEHKDWPSFSWNQELVHAKLNEVYKAVGYLMGRLSLMGFDDKMSAIAEALSHDIIASSEIEGVELNTEQVRSSVARKLGVPTTSPVQVSRYVDGVVEMALDATVNYSAPLTHERLFGWHNCLFPSGWSGTVKIDVAQYRSGEMKVISGMLGREKVHYAAPSAERVEEEMTRFLEWFNSDTQNGYLKSAVAHLWFVCIHPFDDGNGRIGRAIADMALSQAENSSMRFFSISHQINADKKQYYHILEKTQKGSCEITEWILWYLDCLLRSVGQSDRILSRVLNKTIFWQNHAETVISARQREVLNLYLDGYPGKLTAKNWARHVKVSPDTAARDIKDLVGKGILVPQQGRVRDVSYGIQCNDSMLVTPKAKAE